MTIAQQQSPAQAKSRFSSSGRVWPQLQPELAEKIASSLHPNELACTLRIVNKAAAEKLREREHMIVRLSKPVPPHAFARHWLAPGATRDLSLAKRRQLLVLTATSGSVRNLEVAIEASGCVLTAEVLHAAVTARQLDACDWLLRQGCPSAGAVAAAAQAGHTDVVEWLLARHQGSHFEAAIGAARGGHVALMDSMLAKSGPPPFVEDLSDLMAAILEGCDLATTQRMHQWILDQCKGSAFPFNFFDTASYAIAASAVDWQEKLQWWPFTYDDQSRAYLGAFTRPDAHARVQWMVEHRYGWHSKEVAIAAASCGNLPTLRYMHLLKKDFTGVDIAAAQAGCLPLLEWLEQIGVTLSWGLMSPAAKSGSLEIMAWLQQRGQSPRNTTFQCAAVGGNEELLDWLMQLGCVMPADGSPYRTACSNGDLTTLRALKRLNCPWGPAGHVFRAALSDECGLPVLRWLLDEGCPMDPAAEHQAKLLQRPDKAKLLAMIAEWKKRAEQA